MEFENFMNDSLENYIKAGVQKILETNKISIRINGSAKICSNATKNGEEKIIDFSNMLIKFEMDK